MKSLACQLSRASGALLAAATLVSLGGCQSPGRSGASGGPGSDDTQAPPPLTAVTDTNDPAGSADILSPGSRIMIIYSGHADVPKPHEELIREDGTISPPLLGKPVQAAGKKVGELQDELLKLYVPDFFKTLTITVKYEERYFFVGGQVRNPRQYPYLSQMTVLKAIQAAGDFTDFAKRTDVRITRSNGKTEIVNCKKAQNNSKLDLPVYPGDRIWVPQRIL